MRPRSVDSFGPAPEGAAAPALSDEEIVRRVLAGESPLFEMIMRRYNQRLFRAVRAILRDDVEAEDVLQEAYVRAYEHLGQFEGRARFSTWRARIAIHEALARRRKGHRLLSLDGQEARSIGSGASGSSETRRPVLVDMEAHRTTPEDEASASELRAALDRALQEMPESLRLVFMLREVEGLDTDETAACLDLSAANVKVRLHRARALLRERIDCTLGAEVRKLHQFAGARCDRLVARVLARIA